MFRKETGSMQAPPFPLTLAHILALCPIGWFCPTVLGLRVGMGQDGSHIRMSYASE